MAIVRYSEQNEYDLVHHSQDCRGWTVTDQAGNQIGTVTDMLVNTDRDAIDSIIIDNAARVAARDIALRDGRVVVRGVFDSAQYTQTRQTATTAATTANYAEMSGATAGYATGVTRRANAGEETIPIVEEELRVGKRTVETGAARVRTTVEEVPVQGQVNLREERVVVERHAVDRPATEADFQTFREGEIEITERAEVPVVAKEARVVEEVAIGKQVEERTETVRDTVRRTDVEVERVDDADNVNLNRRTTNS